MNRKMRAKINNQKARAAKERKPCPKRDEVFFNETHCDACGEELQQAALVRLSQQEETLH